MRIRTYRLHLVGFLTEPYSRDLRVDLTRLSTSGTVGEVCSYNVLLGRLFASAAGAVVAQCGMDMEEIDLIGSHGYSILAQQRSEILVYGAPFPCPSSQTIHHLPTPSSLHGHQVSSTLQIGDPSVIANECGVTTVGDFRPADMAVGGQGAPLVPYFDQALLQRHFKEQGRVGVLVNIGGISNISVFMPPNGQSDRQKDAAFIGFDCGPGIC